MRAVARNFLLVTGSRVLDGAVRFVTVPIVLGYFGRADFGLVALAFSMNMFLSIADFGISVNAVRRLTELLQQKKHGEVVALVHAASFHYLLVGLFNLAVVLLIGLLGQAWFDLDERQARAFFWMMLSLGATSALTWAFSIYRQVLHASGQVGWDEGINLAGTALTVLGVWATLQFRLDVATYFLLALLPPLLPLALRVRRARQRVPGLRLGLARDWARFRPLVGTSAWLFLMSLAELLANHYRPVILAQRASLEAVADFRVIQQVAGFATLLLGGVMSVVYPAVARLDAAGDQARLALALTRGTRLLLWAHLGLLVPLAFLAAPLLGLYVGRSFEHLAGSLALWLLALVAYHNAIISSLVLARGRVAWLGLSAALAAALTLGVAHALAPRFGVAAMVWAYTAYMAIQLAVMYFVLLPGAGGGSGFALAARVWPRPLIFALVAVAAALAVVRATGAPPWVAGLLFAPLFALAAWRLGGARDDLRAVRAGTG